LANFLERKVARRCVRFWNGTFVFLLLLGFLAQFSTALSRGSMVAFYIVNLLLIAALRWGIHRAAAAGIRSGRLAAKTVFLVGSLRDTTAFLRLYNPSELGVVVVGHEVIDDQRASAHSDAGRFSLQVERALRRARLSAPDAIFLVMPWFQLSTIDQCVDCFRTLPVEIHLTADHILKNFDEAQVARFGAIATLQLARQPLTRREMFLKRVFDFAAATLGLVVLSPLLAALAIAIKLDSPGPVFFLQRRYGFNQCHFRVVKFRTMVTLEDDLQLRQVSRHDARVTRVGRWLRRWNLDELPQLLNVIRGDMSLVGPRPHALAHNFEYEQKIALYARRHNVKPGITGWAQIHGLRGETDSDQKMRDRVAHDLYYIEHWSMWLDLRILVRTVCSPTAYRNAY
jgi:Undecaprenyl-phosphate glucose phosphotransferase